MDTKPKLPNTADSDKPFYSVDKRILETGSQPFISHSGAGKYESYLAQNIPFEPTRDLRKQIENRYGLSLDHRGEAHITVITPPEFERLSSHLDIESLNELAFESIQNIPYQLVCLGLGVLTANETTMLTFFAVARSSELTELREKIASAYTQAGGPAPAFLTPYRPHITLGFTHRDLHESDGIDKNKAACVSEIIIGPSTSL